MKLDKSSSRDLITLFWYKKLYFYRNKFTGLYQSTYNSKEHLPPWLPQTRIKVARKKPKLPSSPKNVDL